MTLVMQYQSAAFGAFTGVDFVATKLYGIKLQQRMSGPASLSWSIHADQHTFPLTFGLFIRFWDDGASDAGGTPYDVNNPNFEGFIEEIEPADSHRVNFVAYDPTSKAGREVQCMSQVWDQGNIPSVPPSEGSGAIPRVVFNSMIDNDDDYQISRGHGISLGAIISTILDDQYQPLYWTNAVPGDGSSAGNGTGYEAADLNLMTFAPQEKLVFESEHVRSALERCLQYEPRVKLRWIPGTRKWRFIDITSAPQTTITLNDATQTNVVLSMDLDRSLEQRATAIKFYGPESHVAAIATQEDGGLLPLDSNDYTVLERVGSVEIRSYSEWQIQDESKRKMAAILPAWVLVRMGSVKWKFFRTESFQASWDGGVEWLAIKGIFFDRRQGIAYTGDIYTHESEGRVVETGTQHYFPPDYMRLVYAYIGEPITVRAPETGFEGTALTVGGLANELKMYDESLAVGFELGTPVTTATRLAQFQVLADTLLAERKDIIHTGGVTMDGLNYSADRLYRRINIDGVDADGNNVATGWEDINAIVTDVEYDYDQQLTTWQFSSDQMELHGWDVEALKDQLKIRALERRFFGQFSVNVTKRRTFTEFGTPIVGADVAVEFDSIRGFENPFTGGIDQAISPNQIGAGFTPAAPPEGGA